MSTLFIDYIPAELRENKQWHVRFYVKNPATLKMQRIRINVNTIKSISERRKYGKRLAAEINKKLEQGWNPLMENQTGKSFHNIYEVFDTFFTTKKRELKDQSLRAYKSDLHILTEFIKKKDPDKKMYVINFTPQIAQEFLTYMYIGRHVSERRYNSILVFCKALFSWMVQNNYITVNPFGLIKKKKEKPKKREVIPENIREQIRIHLSKEDPRFLTFLLIEFYALLRPNEILGLKVSDIDLARQVITVPPELSKSGKFRISTIPDVLMEHIKALELEKYPKTMYVFSDKLSPGMHRLQVKNPGRKWIKLRKDLKLKKEYQMYSLRDTGIINLLQSGVSVEEAAKQADHHSLAITSVYALHANKSANSQIKQKTIGF